MHTLVGTVVDMGSKAFDGPSPAYTGVSAQVAVEVGNSSEKGSIGTAVAERWSLGEKAGGTCQ